MVRCKVLVKEKRDQIEKLSKKLLEKDILSFIEINEILGDRPWEPHENLKRFLSEIAKKSNETKEQDEQNNSFILEGFESETNKV